MQAGLGGLEAVRKHNRQRERGWASATPCKLDIKHVRCVLHCGFLTHWPLLTRPLTFFFLRVHLEELLLWREKKTRIEGGKGFHNKYILLKRGCEFTAFRFKKALSELFPPAEKSTLRLDTCATLWHCCSIVSSKYVFFHTNSSNKVYLNAGFPANSRSTKEEPPRRFCLFFLIASLSPVQYITAGWTAAHRR